MAARKFTRATVPFSSVPVGASFKCADGVLNVKTSEVLAQCLSFDREQLVVVGFHPAEKVMIVENQ